jgi:hypothetical protein
MTKRSFSELSGLSLLTSALLILSSCLLSSCSVLHPAAGMECISRDGQCFDATINGQAVTPIRSRAALARFEKGLDAVQLSDLQNTRWELREPVDGLLETSTAINSLGAKWFGAEPEAELLVTSIGTQRLKTAPSLAASENVQVRGKPALVQQNEIVDKRLPAGPYILTLTVRGKGNWDRKYILANVRR